MCKILEFSVVYEIREEEEAEEAEQKAGVK